MERRPHPIDENGVPIPPEPVSCDYNPECKYANSKIGCGENRHHPIHPRADYKTRIEHEYRESMIVWLCKMAHDNHHAETIPPPKPTIEVMRRWLQQIKHQRQVYGTKSINPSVTERSEN